MKFAFNNFQFDTDQLILSSEGHVLVLNEKPAQLLALFLNESDKILSKEEILAKVWPERVVTDQVVFQNISRLRAMFGDDAIKTFPKKGYQWQLAATPVAIPVNDAANLTNDKVSTKNGKAGLKLHTPFVVKMVGVVLISIGILLFWQSTNKQANETVNLWLSLPDSSSSAWQTQLNQSIEDSDIVSLTHSDTAQSLFDSPFSTWDKHNRGVNSIFVATRVYEVKDNLILRYRFQGKYRGWEGYLASLSLDEVTEEFHALLNLIQSSDYFSVKSDNAALALLTLLRNDMPDSLPLQFQLITLSAQLGYLDRAIAMTDATIDTEYQPFYLASLHLRRATLALANQNWQGQQANFNKALSTFESLGLPHLVAETLMESSWVFYLGGDVEGSLSVLQRAANQARKANEPLLEVKAILMQAFLAAKSKQVELMNRLTLHAQQLIELHELGQEHQIRVLYNLAWGAETQEQAVKKYKEILNEPFSKQYAGLFYTAARKIREYAIEQQDWNLAAASIKPWQSKSFVLLSRAHISLAKQEWVNGIQNAIEAHRQAQIDQVSKDALDAALLLLQQADKGAEVRSLKEYEDYIRQNATHRWRNQNQQQLESLADLNLH